MKLLAYLIAISLCTASYAFCLQPTNTTQQLAPLKLLGKYALESEDPFHRHASVLEPAYLLWKKDQRGSLSFWDYLETFQQELEPQYPAIYDPEYHMVWLDDEQRQGYEAVLDNNEEGELMIHTHSSFLADGKWMFVQLRDRIYVGEEILFKFHHTSLSGGEDVDMAGTFSTKGGVVKKITFSSGHYRPTVFHGVQFIHNLLEKGIHLSNFEVAFFINGSERSQRKQMTIEEFLVFDPELEENSEEEVVPLLPIQDIATVSASKVHLFLTSTGEIYVGDNSWLIDAHEIESLGIVTATASAYLQEGKIVKIKFNQIQESTLDNGQIQRFLQSLAKNLDDADSISFVIKNTQKTRFRLSDWPLF